MNYQRGINSAAKYPYRGQGNFACKVFKEELSIGKIKKFNRIQSGDEEFLKTILYKVGPLAIAINASLEFLQNYKSGVYYDPQCSTDVNHAVLLGNLFEFNFKVFNYIFHTQKLVLEYGIDYWSIKNSWGELGYLRLARNSNNHCGVTNAVVYPDIEQFNVVVDPINVNCRNMFCNKLKT